ncbi:MAG: TIGR01210 family radical SAM protein [Candidatus Lokiarchaeota archaeon]|nr:TIGR01210 family radical SAM protein [Candidatus Lokiarchaeota archaeon]
MKLNENEHKYDCLAEEIEGLRKQALRNRTPYSDDKLHKPVAFWTKKERLLDKVGKEFTIILRTKGCYWALEHGGCSMCGYIEDANIEDVSSEQIIHQFDNAIQNKITEIREDSNDYVLKIFNSGSFFDDSEINKQTREYIYKKVTEIPQITEFIVESRTEFVTEEKLIEIKNYLPDIYIEIGIGLESVDDHIRNKYINKGLTFEDFLHTKELCERNDVGIKAYLLFKPPFLNEQASIDDCMNSIKTLIDVGIKSISVNPCNVQKNSFVEYLWYQNRYRPPWYYSLFECFKKALNSSTIQNTRILCDPSGAGTKRGIHNCLRKECNEKMRETLSQFVLSQDLDILNEIEYDCICKSKYDLQKNNF